MLVDPSTERLDALRKRFPSSTRGRTLDDVSELPDLVIVASPVAFHAENTRHALGRGAHVLCEKPMALSSEECQSMIDASEAHRRLLSVGLFRRFFPAVRQMKALIESGVMGNVRAFNIVEGVKFQWRSRSDSLFRKSTAGGGVLMDIGTHVLDIALYWFGEPSSVGYEDDAMGGVEANCRIELTYGHDLKGSVHLSREWNLANRYHVQFDKGWAAWVPGEANELELGFDQEFAMRAAVHDLALPPSGPLAGNVGMTFHQCFMAQIENALDSIRDHGSLVVSGDEGARSIRVIESCYRNRRLIAMSWMPSEQWASANELAC